MMKEYQIETEITLNVKPGEVYQYLKNRYQDERYRAVSQQLKNYVPNVQLHEDDGKSFLSFYVAGRDVFSEMKVGGWNWGYEISEDRNNTRVRIFYDWKAMMEVTTFGTVKHQAANEVVETVMALQALEQSLSKSGN